jgi:hypothetical protein
MKRLILLVSFMLAGNIEAQEFYTKTPVLDYLSTDMDYIFEIKTTKFEKVTLDCQSFFNGINFYENGEVKHNIYLEMFECEEMNQFFKDSKAENLPVCLGLDTEMGAITLSRETLDCL